MSKVTDTNDAWCQSLVTGTGGDAAVTDTSDRHPYHPPTHEKSNSISGLLFRLERLNFCHLVSAG